MSEDLIAREISISSVRMLTLPAAGYRTNGDGALSGRGIFGYY